MIDLSNLPQVAAVVVPFLLAAWAVGYWMGRRTRTEIVSEAATATLDLLVERQTADDRRAAKTLPPTVTLSDAWAHASKTGLGLEEAAEDLLVARARALIADNLRKRPKGTP